MPILNSNSLYEHLSIHQLKRRMKILASLIFMAFIFNGCSLTYQVRSSAEANKRLEHKNATIYQKDDLQYEGEDIHVVGDSLTFKGSNDQSLTSIALRDITKVERTNHGRGIGQGMVLGACTAICIFGTMMLVDAGKPHDPESKDILGGFIIAGSGVLGATLGAIVGGGIGSHETYIMNGDSLGVHSIGIELPKK
jgi:hypothetical protein